MAKFILVAAIVIIACVIFNKVSDKMGIPMLLAFIGLGMFFGSDGLIKIYFADYALAENACSAALIFIMFYGGFGTNWKQAKPIALKAGLLSSVGTVLTALLVGVFCHFALKFTLLEGMLVGAVLSSTDAASVFSILKSRNLSLKYNTSSLLEVESGSNDPFAYMLTVILLSLMHGDVSTGKLIYTLFAQLFFGVFCGIGLAVFALVFLKRFNSPSEEFDTIFIVAIALISYALPMMIGGNGYLSAYICGIILGNKKIENKTQMVHFFDALTGLMQMFLFFILGLLCFPSQLPKVALPALCIALFLTFVARPLAVFLIMTPFKSKIRQQLLVSWSGLRGVASIVFAIVAVMDPANIQVDIFNIVFCIVLFSILIQGSLIPAVAKKLDMTDTHGNVMKTFTDYTDEVPVQFIEFKMTHEHPWINSRVKDILLPPDSLLVLILREGDRIIPRGNTKILENDTLVLSGKVADKEYGVKLFESVVEEDNEYLGKTLSEIPDDYFIIAIMRNDKAVIPKGNTVLKLGDTIILTKHKKPEKHDKVADKHTTDRPQPAEQTAK